MGRNSTGGGGRGRAGVPKLGTRVVDASSLVGRVTEIGGGPIKATSEARLKRVGGLFDAGRQNQGRGVVVTVRRNGTLEIDDGRHRLIEGARRGAKVKVTFRRGR